MEYLVIENDPCRISFFEDCGVDRIFIDLEVLGKTERQGHLDTVKSNHVVEDIEIATEKLHSSMIHVRINPWNSNSIIEIEECINAGADILMLPMFKTSHEVEAFLTAVSGRCKVSLLLETPQAFMRLDEILDLNGIDEIHIGLNDLHLGLGLDFMLEIYCSSLLEQACSLIKKRGISFGIGGIAPLGEGVIPGQMVLLEAYRLGAERFILSRAFSKSNLEIFLKNFQQLKKFELKLNQIPQDELELNRIEMVKRIRHFVSTLRDY